MSDDSEYDRGFHNGALAAGIIGFMVFLIAVVLTNEHNDFYYRRCLRSRNAFVADSAFLRVLPDCKEVIAAIDVGARK